MCRLTGGDRHWTCQFCMYQRAVKTTQRNRHQMVLDLTSSEPTAAQRALLIMHGRLPYLYTFIHVITRLSILCCYNGTKVKLSSPHAIQLSSTFFRKFPFDTFKVGFPAWAVWEEPVCQHFPQSQWGQGIVSEALAGFKDNWCINLEANYEVYTYQKS